MKDLVSNRSKLVTLYTSFFSLLGFGIVILAFSYLPEDKVGLFLFAALAGIAELSRVELFTRTGGSGVSVAIIIAIAGILALNPFAGVITGLVAGLISPVIQALLGESRPNQEKRSFIRRVFFNIGMFAVSNCIAGWLYVLLGGQVGSTVQVTNIVPILVSVVAAVLVNILILIGVIALQTGKSPFEIWKINFQWAATIQIVGCIFGGCTLAVAYEKFSVLGLAVFFLPVISIGYSHRLYVNHTKKYVDDLENTRDNLKKVNQELEAVNLELDETNIGLLETLGTVIDAYDVYTRYHSTQVTVYADAIARKMGLSKDEISAVVKAGLVHDVGKIGVPDTIIGKQGALTRDEISEMRRHPVISADILRRMKGMQALIPLVRHHHEQWNGAGYPAGLAGEEIPLGARILALADCIEAMSSDRPYRHGRSFEEVRAEVIRCTGMQFDPQVVEAFLDVVEEKGPGFLINTSRLVHQWIQPGSTKMAGQSYFFLKKSAVLDSASPGSHRETDAGQRGDA
jgi:putative nucleotidyltransferase with HDIG domain